MRFPLGFVVLLAIAAVQSARAGELLPSDPYFTSHGWHLTKIGLPAAWMQTTGSANITVAILDTGVMTATPDLNGRLLPATSTAGTEPFSQATLHGTEILHHGTWVASAAAMQINNGIGGAGVGNFSILPITVTNSNGNNQSDWLAGGIRAAADAGAKVINVSHSTLSLGQLEEAAAYARGLGALTFVAGGNIEGFRDHGMAFPNLIFVAGTNPSDGRWSAGNRGSTWGPFIDLAAPAENILVADPTLSTGYGLTSGTSFAAPLAAGVAGLVWSINPSLSPGQVESILYGSAVDLGSPGWDEVYGHGRVNAAAAVQVALATVPEPASVSLALFGLAMVVAWRQRSVNRQLAV